MTIRPYRRGMLSRPYTQHRACLENFFRPCRNSLLCSIDFNAKPLFVCQEVTPRGRPVLSPGVNRPSDHASASPSSPTAIPHLLAHNGFEVVLHGRARRPDRLARSAQCSRQRSDAQLASPTEAGGLTKLAIHQCSIRRASRAPPNLRQRPR